jgi:PKD repeat protein
MNTAVDRVSSLDPSYQTGDLSIFPAALDTPDQLYQVANNAETTLAKSVSYIANYIVVTDATSFPSSGLFMVGTELVYYSSRSNNVFQGLARGFAGSRRNQWPIGTTVSQSVMAEPHNALKDALINIETELGLQGTPSSTSLNGILTGLETKFLAPKPLFRALPSSGVPPLTVAFQNFSGGEPIRFLWDFGDGSTSVELTPTHTYKAEGNYTVQLNMITSLGGQGFSIKTNYIQVSNSFKPAFFYVTPTAGTTATTFQFVDQTDGDVVSRYWVWDDGTNLSIVDPDIHTATHIYSQAGTYNPTLIVVFSDQHLDRVLLDQPIIVTI